MDNLKKQSNLSDLRNDKFNQNSEIFFEKSMFGGYNKKAVAMYIKDINTRLSTAERSFGERLEEYSAMSSMLTQERDKYMKMLHENEGEAAGYRQQIIDLEKEKNELNLKINELTENIPDENELHMLAEKLTQNEEMKNQITELENQIKEYEGYKNYIEELKSNIEQLELTINDLNDQIENYASNEVLRAEYDNLASENELIKQQYDDVMYEKSMLMAEKNVLTEQNKRLNENLAIANEKNSQLRENNTKIKLKTRKMMAEFESKLYECSQNHKQNIEQITDNVKSVLNIITYENMDITKLLNIADSSIDFDDDLKNEFNLESEQSEIADVR